MSKNNNRSSLRPWIVLAAATGVNVSMGLNYSWSIIQKSLITDWKWTNLEAALPYTVYAVMITLAMIIGGRLQAKAGPRLSINLGAILMGTGLISCSFSHNPLLTVLAYSIAGIGAGICYATTMPTIIKWFPPEKKGLVTGIVVSGSGLAPIFVSLIANWLLGHYGISNTFLALGIGISSSLLIMSLFMKNPPADYIPPSTICNVSQPIHTARLSSEDIYWREMIKTPTFYKLWLMYFFVSSAGLMIIGHITSIAKNQANWENGFYLVVLVAFFNTIGRMVAGFCSDKYGRITIMKSVFLILTINLILFSNYTNPALLAFGTAIIGFCYGTCPALFPLTIADFYGTKNLGSNYGMLFTAWGSAALLGPVIAGLAVDMTGTYSIAYTISAALLFGAFLLSMSIKEQREQEVIIGEITLDNTQS
ncbi:MAG: major facilitator family transporter [Firmicutes bacterium]|nr:major facilitator family transporter [Bacillota bacterium]